MWLILQSGVFTVATQSNHIAQVYRALLLQHTFPPVSRHFSASDSECIQKSAFASVLVGTYPPLRVKVHLKCPLTKVISSHHIPSTSRTLSSNFSPLPTPSALYTSWLKTRPGLVIGWLPHTQQEIPSPHWYHTYCESPITWGHVHSMPGEAYKPQTLVLNQGFIMFGFCCLLWCGVLHIGNE